MNYRGKKFGTCSVVFFSMDFPLCVYTQEYSQTHDSLFPNTESVFNINYLCERVYSACICVGQRVSYSGTPQCLCSLPPPQSSPAAPEFCRLCRQSCRSNASGSLWGRSFQQTPQTWPGMERRSALCIAEMLNQQSRRSADSLPTKIYKRSGKNSPRIRKILYNSQIFTNIYFLCYNSMGQKTFVLRCLHDRSYGNNIFSQLSSTLTQTLNVYTNGAQRVG